MIQELSSQLVLCWKNAGVISDDVDSLETYRYGLELFFSSIFNLFFLIVISVIFGIPFAFVPYLLGFMPIRVMAGGYHANAHWSCMAVFSATYTLALIIVQHQGNFMAPAFCVVVSVLSMLSTWIFSPVPAKNKPLSPLDAMTYRKISLVFSFLFFVIAVYKVIFSSNVTLSIRLFFYGEGMSALSLIISKLISKYSEI